MIEGSRLEACVSVHDVVRLSRSLRRGGLRLRRREKGHWYIEVQLVNIIYSSAEVHIMPDMPSGQVMLFDGR